MTAIKRVQLPVDEMGNDPNDHRENINYLASLRSFEKQSPDMDWLEKFTLTESEAAMLNDPVWVFPDLIIEGHLIAIPAPPNGGKTTILMWVAGEIAEQYDVVYVNSDIAGSDAKEMIDYSKANNFQLLLPDMKVGRSMTDVVQQLEIMNKTDVDYSEYVFIFDTLKKMTDVINKSAAKNLLKTLRGLSAKGMTIILLSHTNKYAGQDGLNIYEGTGDIRSDVDELIYFDSHHSEDGSLIVSTRPDKKRGKFQPITFNVSPDREVSVANTYVDVGSVIRAEQQLEKDEPIIDAIKEAIITGRNNQSEIVDYCRVSHAIGWRSVKEILRRYSTQPLKLWRCERAFKRNVHRYYLEESSPQ